MKILIIGNGFDVAHELPTKYTEFLECVKDYKRQYICGPDSAEPPEMASALCKALNDNEIKNEFNGIIEKNVWLDYFVKKQTSLGNKWIDCEEEIKKVISRFETTYINHGSVNIGIIPADPISIFFDGFRKPIDHLKVQPGIRFIIERDDIPNFIKFLFDQLRSFTRAFEIYCDSFVNKMVETYAIEHDLQNLSLQAFEATIMKAKGKYINGCSIDYNDIDKILGKYEKLVPFRIFDFDRVLSFNYTKTFELLYGNHRTNLKGNSCFIHGKAQPIKDETNLILGIDDQLNDGNENSQFAFANFKKYFQRIFYKTGSEYKNWIWEIIQDSKNNDMHEIHIFGHSLGRTDHEVLKEFFNINCDSEKNVMIRIIIYYHDGKANINVIERVIEMIYKPALIKRVHGENWTIRFINQHEEESEIIKSNFFKIETGKLKKI